MGSAFLWLFVGNMLVKTVDIRRFVRLYGQIPFLNKGIQYCSRTILRPLQNASGFFRCDFSMDATSVVIPDSTQPTEQWLYPALWKDMTAYNEEIFKQGQAGLSCKLDYQQPSFRLADYGLKEEVFGVITIPAMELEMPIYLGATEQHMADGAAQLSQTSLPIGGANTNSVIAGHRGYGGASYFRYIDQLQIGDTITVTNLWEQLTYRVAEIKII